MKYDFTTIMDRRGKDAVALDGLGSGMAPDAPGEGYDAIPMWVADMNFPACPSITTAIQERVTHPAFGYFNPRKEYFDSIIRWQERRHGLTGVEDSFIGYENGVLGGVVSALNTMCSRGDNVLVHSPTYIGFTGCLANNGYHIVHSELVKDSDGVWRMDYADMERKIRDNNIHAAILCTPHNPCGRVWTRDELSAAYELFEKYDVKVVADEIWSDIILNGAEHVPSLTVSDWAWNNTAMFCAPSKTFNLAGLVGSYHIIPNKTLRDRVTKESSLSHYNSMNVLSMYGLIGAYTDEGAEWTDELCQVISGNVNFACDYITRNFPGVSVTKPQGTYMLFVDCTDWCEEHNTAIEQLEKSLWAVGAAVQDGRMFHGPCHLRMNLALPLSRVKEAFDRMSKIFAGSAD